MILHHASQSTIGNPAQTASDRTDGFAARSSPVLNSCHVLHSTARAADFGQERRRQCQTREHPQAHTRPFGLQPSHQQNERRAETQRRERVILDRVKRRLRHERDQRRHAEPQKQVVRENHPRGHKAQAHERNNEKHIQEADPIEQETVVKSTHLS
jgi:hypothetical protein